MIKNFGAKWITYILILQQEKGQIFFSKINEIVRFD